MAAQEQPLDEIIWRNPEWVLQLGGIHENTVLYYFAKSPFFDPTSNNASVETQAMFNPDMLSVLETREAFETHLDKLNGLEYRVAYGPKDFDGERPIGRGHWVIRKQNRRTRHDAGEPQAEVSVLATYFVVGESIYMSPSIGNILTCRLLSTSFNLRKLFDEAAALTKYTPALGNHYIPPSLTAQKPGTQTESASKEQTPARESSVAPMSKPIPSTNAELSTLLDAYTQFNMYSHEYIDENPLLGEPGSFVFSSSREHVRVQQEAAATRIQQQADLKNAQAEARVAAAKAAEAEQDALRNKSSATAPRKLSRSDGRPSKLKRRKSRMTPAASPRSPPD